MGTPDERPAEYAEGAIPLIEQEPAAIPAPPPSRLRHWKRNALLIGVIGALLVLAIVLAYDAWIDDPADETARPTSEPEFIRGGDWPTDVVAVSHTLPAMIKNELRVSGERHGYQFQGKAGQAWIISVEVTEGNLDPVASLYGEPGVELGRNDDRTAEDFNSELVFTVPQDGTYRLLVESSQGGNTTGSYLLTVWVE